MACITSSSKGCTTPGGAFSQHTACPRQIFRTWTLRNEAGNWLAICLEPKGHREGGLRKGGSRGAPGTPAHFNHSSSTGSVLGVQLKQQAANIASYLNNSLFSNPHFFP